MSVTELGVSGPGKSISREVAGGLWMRFVFRSLNKVYETSEVVRINNRSKIVFFSDCHRGDNGKADAFRHNKAITAHAMNLYYRLGFTYVEVGDGDDLWQVPHFSKIERAHSCIFRQLRKFQDSGRLYIILGNHEIRPGQRHLVRKGNFVAPEGLVLKHEETGKSIFVVHGHQADFFSGFMIPISRLTVRYLVRKLHAVGWLTHQKEISALMSERGKRFVSKMEKPLLAWAEAYRHILICGHTHRAAYPKPGDPPYFNSGSCVYPGFITALELTDGHFQLVKWLPGENEAVRVPMSRPIPISSLG
jgi:UDP-2,3-diacylglucosamine pyrophosphatase LpxH